MSEEVRCFSVRLMPVMDASPELLGNSGLRTVAAGAGSAHYSD